jgi:hypothetical protein
MAYNQMLLKQFEDRVAKWTADGCLGDIFVKTVRDMLNLIWQVH